MTTDQLRALVAETIRDHAGRADLTDVICATASLDGPLTADEETDALTLLRTARVEVIWSV
jgi:hypothetical protein